MAKFQSLILILIILVSVLIARPSQQGVKKAQTRELKAAASAVVSTGPEQDRVVDSESSQEIIPEQIPEQITEQVKAQTDEPEKVGHGDYTEISEIPEIELPDQTPKEITKSQAINFPQSIVSAEVALVKYLDSNFNVFELGVNKHWPIASLTKLMTAVIAIENGDLDQEILINGIALETEGTTGGFSTGEIYKAKDLIKAMLISSSNDAAVALAETTSWSEFVWQMNQKANELNMTATNFNDPTGLSFLNQSTVNDLTNLINYIYYTHPEILEITRQKEVEILELVGGEKRKLTNNNKFADQANFVGGKTGFIDASGENLISLFNQEGKLVLIVVLGSDNRFVDTEKLLELVAKP